MRASCVSPTSPNRLLLKLPFGLVNCVWLNMLKNSARTSTAIDSVMATLFAIPKSVLRIPAMEEPSGRSAESAEDCVLLPCIPQEETVVAIGVQVARVSDDNIRHQIRLVGIAAG